MNDPYLFEPQTIFGRKADLKFLLDRAPRHGVTAITGRAQMGKSTLLQELAFRLQRTTVGIAETGYLVGYVRNAGQTQDLMLRTVSDLYGRWLANADAAVRAQMMWEQQRESLSHASKATRFA